MKSKHFKIHELVPESLYKAMGEKAWKLIDSRLIETIDELKEHFNLGTIIMNNYYWDGDRQWSGLRTSDSPNYSKTSQHTFGRAIDAIFSEYTAAEVRNYIMGNQHKFPYIKGIELGVSWLHIDCRNEDFLVTFKS